VKRARKRNRGVNAARRKEARVAVGTSIATGMSVVDVRIALRGALVTSALRAVATKRAVNGPGGGVIGVTGTMITGRREPGVPTIVAAKSRIRTRRSPSSWR
jgi:hypothetical protein